MSSERCPENYTATYQYGYKLGKEEEGKWVRTSDFGPHYWTHTSKETHDLTQFGHGYTTVTTWHCNYCREEDEVVKHYSILRDDVTSPPMASPQ